MTDVIDFNKLKNRVSDKDIDKFEEYIYGLYYSMANGTLKMGEFTKQLKEYMDKNNVSEEKLMNIQKKLMERYGFDPNDLENQMKTMGIDMKSMGLGNINYEDMRKTLSFHEKYKANINMAQVSLYSIKNELNDLDIILNNEKVIVTSNKNVDLKDNELNEFLCSYKKVNKDKNLEVIICENSTKYEY